jgi:hypothetical protein
LSRPRHQTDPAASPLPCCVDAQFRLAPAPSVNAVLKVLVNPVARVPIPSNGRGRSGQMPPTQRTRGQRTQTRRRHSELSNFPFPHRPAKVTPWTRYAAAARPTYPSTDPET